MLQSVLRDRELAASDLGDLEAADVSIVTANLNELVCETLADGSAALAEAVSIPVTASGGMSSLDDIRALFQLEGAGVDEVIVGRALYLNKFSLAEAIAVARGGAAG